MSDFCYGGYIGKILRINLSNGQTKVQDLNKEFAENYVGGRGFGSRIIYDEVDPKLDAFDPGNKLVIATGPLSGTKVPSAPKFHVATKSPLTGLMLNSSAAGYFAPEMKFAGYDAIIIEGKSPKPVFLWINEGNVEIRDADWLWGLDTSVTDRLLKENVDAKSKIACIGPAGENLVRYACIISEWRAAGRGGAGAVLGSKNLKAIAVRGEEKEPKISNSKLFDEAVRQAYEAMAKEPLTGKIYRANGTTYNIEIVNSFGMYPTKNFQEGVFQGADKVSGEAIKNKLYLRNKPCYRCPISCSKISAVKDGEYAGVTGRGPEYETAWAFSAQCNSDSLEAVLVASGICDNMGLDTISTGNVIGFAMECYEKRLLSQKDCPELKFGDTAKMLTLIRQIAYRKGIGDLLAEGVKIASERMGRNTDKLAMHVKGMELPAYDPRGAWGMGLAYATANRGGCHLDAWTIAAELTSGVFDRCSITGKAKLVKDDQDRRTAVACTGLCVFASKAVNMELVSKLLFAITGVNLHETEMMNIGARVYNIERTYNVRCGISRSNDALPDRFFDEPIPDGVSKGKMLSHQEFEKMLDEYYSLRGWNSNGVPSKQSF